MSTATNLRKLGDYIRLIANRMKLADWKFILDSTPSDAGTYAQIACADSRKSAVVRVTADPPNTIEFQFAGVAPGDCQLIAEYSVGDGIWHPLAFVDGIDGAAASRGVIHFEPPGDWVQTRKWDAASDIGGGASGTGPNLYWIRLQRRNDQQRNQGASMTSAKAANRPYVVARRVDNALGLTYQPGDVGTGVIFRFVPMGRDGQAHPEKAVYFKHTILG